MTKPEVSEDPVEPTLPSTSFIVDLSDGEDSQRKAMTLSDCASRFMRRASLRNIKRSPAFDDKEPIGDKPMKVGLGIIIKI